MSKKTIVITGCSSGFGRATALGLAQRNWHVFGTVRKEADRANLLTEATGQGCQENITLLLCDITDEDQVKELAQQVEQHLREGASAGEEPHLDALLNNAGTAVGGPLELLPLDELRAQFEINVFAHVNVIQAFLPLLKAIWGSTIINVSSVSGRVATPIMGAYAASKFALEAISDALRVELAHFGVRVVIIEPTSSPTNIWETSLQRALPWLGRQREGPYGRLLAVTEKVARRSSKVGFPVQRFVDTVVRILDNRDPRPRYPVPASAARDIFVRGLLPDRVWDFMLRRALKW